MGNFLEFRILGPVEAWLDGRPLPLAAAKQQALLAAGLLRGGRTVSVDRLIAAVWGDPPASAPTLIKGYVSALRRVVHRPGLAPVIVTRPPGYAFQVQPGMLDLHRFESHVAEGRRAAAANRPDQVHHALHKALQLWSGPALGGLGGSLLQAEAARLEELRHGVVEDRIAAELALGRAGTVLPELVGLVAAHPMRERLRGHLMVALARLGRQAEALEAYRVGCAYLRDNFGLEPGPELQRLHRTVLRGGTVPGDGEMTPTARVTLPARRECPAHLPPDPGGLTGRDALIGTTVAALRAAATAASPATIAISGMPGVGKSALAVHAARLVRGHFPDGQLYAQFDADTSAPGVREVLAHFLRTLGHPESEVPASSTARSCLLRGALSSRRLLILLDGVRSERQVRPLLPGTPGCAVVITGRTRMAGLETAEHIALDPLTPEDSVRLLERLVGAGRVGAERPAAREIARLCGHLPLALRAAGARLVVRQSWPLAMFAARLRDDAHRLDELTAGDLDVRTRFRACHRTLIGSAREALALLGAAGLSSITPATAAPVLAVSTAEAGRRLDHLAESRLMDLLDVDAEGQPRYGFHELTRVFAGECGVARVRTGPRVAAGCVRF